MKNIPLYHAIETLFRKATEHVLAGMIQRHFELMALDMESHFKAFAQRSPHLLNQLPQKDIASYLRIDATNFSKLLASVRINWHGHWRDHPIDTKPNGHNWTS